MSVSTDEVSDDLTMASIFLPHGFDDDDEVKLFGDQCSVSFSKRDTNKSTYSKLIPLEVKRVKRGFEEFCTGSSYIGEWNSLGFCGQGAYIFPHGTEYEGRFNNRGQFHGPGSLTFPGGQRMHGVWKNGKLFEYAYIFTCGEELDEHFMYCQMPDRRFHVEIQKYFGPTGHEYLTADQPTRELPRGCYDTVDGIYYPKYKFIMSHECLYRAAKHVLAPQIQSCSRKLSDELILKGRVVQEIPTEEKIKWIVQNCRKGTDETTGYRPDLYETWDVGRKEDRETHVIGAKDASTSIFCDKIEREVPKLVSFIKKVKKPVLGKFNVFVSASPRVTIIH